MTLSKESTPVSFSTVPTVIRALVSAALLSCLCVVVLGAYVRLSNAGLGCPDWPGCYGHLTPSGAAADTHVSSSPLARRPLEVGKAWREMVHRYAAGTLGLLILSLVFFGIVRRCERVVPLRYVWTLLAIVVAQALLGMLTVTWKLTPLIVTLHLLLGFTTLSLLLWLALSLPERARASRPPPMKAGTVAKARLLALFALIALGVQIALGGWTSSNYAAVGCPDFPTCQAQWWPMGDYRAAFELRGASGHSYEGGVLDAPARTAIQFTHRVGAIIITLVLLSAAFSAWRLRKQFARRAASLVIVALTAQLIIGSSMVLLGFPLWLATAHSAGAALLLMATVGLNRAVRPSA
ncbi:MAG: COX15/CtaA family protein [Steroidobacteraceae bacterium]